MSKFKTRGGKTVVFDTEAIGINDPLLGSSMALGGRSVRKQKANERRKQVRKEKKFERAQDEAVAGRGTNPRTARKMQQKEAIRRRREYGPS